MSAGLVALMTLEQGAPAPGPGPATPAQATTWLIALTAGVLAAFIIAGVVIYIVRSRMLKSQTTQGGPPLTLHDVREMHRCGEIDDAEMARLKGIVTGQAKKVPDKPAKDDGTKTE